MYRKYMDIELAIAMFWDAKQVSTDWVDSKQEGFEFWDEIADQGPSFQFHYKIILWLCAVKLHFCFRNDSEKQEKLIESRPLMYYNPYITYLILGLILFYRYCLFLCYASVATKELRPLSYISKGVWYRNLSCGLGYILYRYFLLGFRYDIFHRVRKTSRQN